MMIKRCTSFGLELAAIAKENRDVVFVDTDMYLACGAEPMVKAVPDQVYNVGIAEQNAFNVAAGLALCGKTAVVVSFAVFASTRAADQVRNTIAYNNLNVKIVGTHAGLETGEDGGTHQALEDISIMRTFPYMKIFVPSTPLQAKKLTRIMLETFGPFYFRLTKNPVEEIYEDIQEFRLGGSVRFGDGKDASILACGNMLEIALQAQEQLKSDGINVRVYDMYSIKPIDEEAILSAAKETKGIVCVEDHSILGGLGGTVAEITASKYPTKVLRVGVNDKYGRSGDTESLREMYGLTPENVVTAVKALQ